MKYLNFWLLLCASLSARAQPGGDSSDYALLIDTADLKTNLHIVAGTEMQGRMTATAGQRKAAEYIESKFKTLGLLPGWNNTYQQPFPVYQDSIIKVSLSIGDAALRRDTDFVVSDNSSFNVAFTASEVLYVGYGLSDSVRDDYASVNARGKIVLVTPGAPTKLIKGKKVKGTVPSFRTLQFAAQKNGAIALFIVDRSFPWATRPSKGPIYFNDNRNNPIPNTFFISDSVARLIMGGDYAIARKMMKKGVPLPNSYFKTVSLELQKNTDRMESSNVIAMLEGSDKKEEAVIITAHYDHLGIREDSILYPGADDDGSGTVSLIEIAEAFSKAVKEGHRPARNIIFMAVSGEEEGLWGSSWYSDNPAFPLDKTSVDLNIDMIGRIDSGRIQADTTNYVFVIGDDKLSSDLKPISEGVNDQHDKLTLDYKYNDPKDPARIYYRSDHYNFAKKGIPVLFYFGGLHADYHRPSDTPDKINYPLLAKRARFIFYTAWAIANRQEMLKRDIPLN